jgi:hypothetical protein
MDTIIKKIISGGQTGADRAALNVAIELGIPHGGWCPRRRLAEDGVIDGRYQLMETPGADSAQRTEWNARDSDGTVIFSIGDKLSGGSARTEEFALNYHKPCLHLSRESNAEKAAEKLVEFVRGNRIAILNVAGPRASEEPELVEFVWSTLLACLSA